MTRQTAMPARATILPADLAQALQDTQHWPAGEKRIARIDELNAEAVRRCGYRPPRDMSMFPPRAEMLGQYLSRAQVWGQDE